LQASSDPIQVTLVSTVPTSMMETEIIRLNKKGFTVVSSEILDDKIKLVSINNFMGKYESKYS
jgi:hypothetical protein